MTSYLELAVVLTISSGTPKAAQISERENLRFSRNWRSALEKCGFDDLGAAPEEERFVGDAGAALAVAEGGENLLALFVVELLVGADDEAEVGVVFHEAVHEGAGGEVGFGGEVGRVGAADMPRQKSNGLGSFSNQTSSGRKTWVSSGALGAEAGVAPADELAVLDDVLEAGGVEDETLRSAECGVRSEEWELGLRLGLVIRIVENLRRWGRACTRRGA